MARARNIKPGFFTNDDLVELDFATRLLFAGLWTVADRAGRLQDRPKKIKIAIFPADDVDVSGMLDHLAGRGFIRRYTVDGQALIQIEAWEKHQNPHHTEKASVLPPFVNGVVTVKEVESDGGNLADSLIPDSGFTDSLQVPTVLVGQVADLKTYTVPDCPYGEIVKAYAETCPILPQPAVLNDSRRKHVNARWREVCGDQKFDREAGLAWFRDFFALVAHSPFLMGRAPPDRSTGRVWKADFDWLMLPTNFVKVVEGRYEQERKAA